MSFVLKKSRPVHVPLGEGPDAPILIVKLIKAQKLVGLYAEYAGQEEEAEEEQGQKPTKAQKKERDQKRIARYAPMMIAMAELVIEATVGWENVVDESGKPVPFSIDALREMVEGDINLYSRLSSVVTEITKATQSKQAAAAKN